MLKNLFLKIVPFMRCVGKCCKAGQATDDNMAHAHCMLDTYGYKYTPGICNTYCFSTATTAERTRHNVTLHVHYLSCLSELRTNILKATLYVTLCSTSSKLLSVVYLTTLSMTWRRTVRLLISDEMHPASCRKRGIGV